jgi:hypothetical protein
MSAIQKVVVGAAVALLISAPSFGMSRFANDPPIQPGFELVGYNPAKAKARQLGHEAERKLRDAKSNVTNKAKRELRKHADWLKDQAKKQATKAAVKKAAGYVRKTLKTPAGVAVDLLWPKKAE